MYVDSPLKATGEGWSVAVHHARASELVRAFDPDLPYVVIEGHSPVRPGWHALPVPLTGEPISLRTRTVRNVRFDMRVSPQDAIDAGAELDNSDQGWLYAWQVPTEPPANLMLSQKQGHARTAALRAAGVALFIDLPHSGETAVLWSPQRELLDAAVGRLAHSG